MQSFLFLILGSFKQINLGQFSHQASILNETDRKYQWSSTNLPYIMKVLRILSKYEQISHRNESHQRCLIIGCFYKVVLQLLTHWLVISSRDTSEVSVP